MKVSVLSSNMLKFADYTKVFKEMRDAMACSMLRSDLYKLISWAEYWQMEFNVKMQGYACWKTKG